MTLSKNIDEALNPRTSIEDETNEAVTKTGRKWMLSIAGAAVDPAFTTRTAHKYRKQAMAIAKKAGLRNFEVTEIGYDDLTFILLDDRTTRDDAIRLGKKLADEVRPTTPEQAAQEFGVVTIQTDDYEEPGDPDDVEPIM